MLCVCVCELETLFVVSFFGCWQEFAETLQQHAFMHSPRYSLHALNSSTFVSTFFFGPSACLQNSQPRMLKEQQEKEKPEERREVKDKEKKKEKEEA